MLLVFQTIAFDSGCTYTFSIVTDENPTFFGTKIAYTGGLRGWHAAYRGTTVDPTEERLVYSSR